MTFLLAFLAALGSLLLGAETPSNDHGPAAEFLALDPRPSALFASNDISAFGALRGLRAAGLAVPDALALAGGPNRFAAASSTVILRKTRDGTIKRIPINYEVLKKGQGLKMNLGLLRGDQVFVP